MTGVNLSEISGALVKKKDCAITCRCYKGDDCTCGYEYFNKAIDEQGQISIGLNRGRLAKTIHATRFGKDSWNIELSYIKKQYLKLADAIISAQKDLLEVKK